MSRSDQLGRITACAALLAVVGHAAGQWVDREYPLNSGWNAIFLEVEPSPSRADELFAGLPITQVWTPTGAPASAGPPDCQDPNDPTCVPPVLSDWDVWVPAADPARVVTNLRVIQGGRVYLVRATSPATLTLTGRPTSRVTRWAIGFNLAGLYVEDDPAAAPTFGTYFIGSPAHAGTSVYELGAAGTPVPIADPLNTRAKAGVGYWIRSSAATEYDGPIAVDKASLRGIDFGLRGIEHAVRIENRAAAARSVELSYVASAALPAAPPGQPAIAGNVPLTWLEYSSGPVASALSWRELTTATWDLACAGAASARVTVRLAIDRAGLAPAQIDATGAGSAYQGAVVVRDGVGFRRWLPVTGQVPAIVASTASALGIAAHPGLYFGQVTVNEVQWVSAGARVWTNADPNNPTFLAERRCVGGGADSAPCDTDAKCPGGLCLGYCLGGGNDAAACVGPGDCPDGRCSAETDNTSLRPVPAAFTFPILVHLDETGASTCLSEVTLLWKPPDEAAQTAGRFVLATPACSPAVCDALQAGSVQDGEPFARRLGTAAFSFDGDLALNGNFGAALGGAYTIPPDHRLNPFRHLYHPDHDCDQSGECFEITRTFTLNFEASPPAGEARPGWGDRLLGGTYAETLTGLHKSPIAVGGRFELTRVSEVAVLNAQ